MDWILSGIKLWTLVSLTYVGHLQLIESVFFSIHVDCCSMFTLPYSVIRRIKSILVVFLYKGYSLSHSGAKIA